MRERTTTEEGFFIDSSSKNRRRLAGIPQASAGCKIRSEIKVADKNQSSGQPAAEICRRVLRDSNPINENF
jgi:hypothetical protein